MLFNDILILETLVLVSILYYLLNSNVMMLLYTGFVFLMSTGLIGLLNDGDIYIGFLWVIDLGVGLIFFIFVLHFSTFLSQKSTINVNLRFRLISTIFAVFVSAFYYLVPNNTSTNYIALNGVKNWLFKLTYLDYYTIYHTHEITDLQTLKESYFVLNSFEFYVINFSLLFGLISSILLFFLIKRIFIFMNYNYLINNKLFNKLNTNFFIRNQDYVKQQNTSMAVRLWSKVRKGK